MKISIAEIMHIQGGVGWAAYSEGLARRFMGLLAQCLATGIQGLGIESALL